jgi:hypothetical protein
MNGDGHHIPEPIIFVVEWGLAVLVMVAIEIGGLMLLSLLR